MTWNFAVMCSVAWLSLAAMVWAIAWVGAPWWGVLIAFVIAAGCGPTYKTGIAALEPDAQIAWVGARK